MRAVGAAARVPEAVIILLAASAVAAVAVAGTSDKIVAPLAIAIIFFVTLHRSLLRWHSLVGLILAIVLFVPIGRYRLPGSLPFNLELYRVTVALVVLIWLASMLIDPNVRLRSTPYNWPILGLVAVILASEVANPGRVDTWGTYVAKTLTFFLSFVLVYLVTATTIHTREAIEKLLTLLVGGAAVIGFFGIIETRTLYNVFDHLHTILPFLILQPGQDSDILRGGNLRVFGPAQHPIALGALLMMITPLGYYLAKTRGRRWLFATILIVLGSLATGSRTAITMFVTEFILLLVYKRHEALRLIPYFVPAIVVVHFTLPGAIGSLRAAFFPKGGIIAEQSSFNAQLENGQLSGGRVRLIRPMVAEASQHPLFGEGLGTRITGFNTPNRNAPILDDQWLNNLVDVGFVGFGIWIWIFVTAGVKNLSRIRKVPPDDPDSWLFLGLGASLIGFGIGMFTFDAFGFTQIFFVFWIVLGLSASALMLPTPGTRVGPRPLEAN